MNNTAQSRPLRKVDRPLKILLTLMVLTATAHAQRKVDFALYAADLSIRTLDITSTHALLASPCNCFHEDDPLSPGGSSLTPLVAYQYGISASAIEGSRRLARNGHPRLAQIGLLVDIAVEVYAVQHNYRQHENAATQADALRLVAPTARPR